MRSDALIRKKWLLAGSCQDDLCAEVGWGLCLSWHREGLSPPSQKGSLARLVGSLLMAAFFF